MKRFFIIILVGTLVLISYLLIDYALQEKQPDPKLIELQQIKMGQIEQVNAELSALRAEMRDIESGLSQPFEMKGVHNASAEELAASLRRPGLKNRLTQLKDQEANLLTRIQYLKQDLGEIEILLKEE